MEYTYTKEGTQFGPYSKGFLASLAGRGEITTDQLLQPTDGSPPITLERALLQVEPNPQQPKPVEGMSLHWCEIALIVGYATFVFAAYEPEGFFKVALIIIPAAFLLLFPIARNVVVFYLLMGKHGLPWQTAAVLTALIEGVHQILRLASRTRPKQT